MKITTVSIVSFVVAGLLVVLSLTAGFLKIIPASLVEAIVTAIAAFFASGAIVLHEVQSVRNHIRNNGGKNE